MSGSLEELSDVKSSYTSNAGDMRRVMNDLKCCTLSDLERHCHTIHRLIDSHQLTQYSAFIRTSAEILKRANARRTADSTQVIISL